MRTRRLGEWLLWLLAAVLGANLVARSLWAAAHPPAQGFVSYYTASRLLLEGDDLSRVVDDAWFGTQARRFQPDAGEVNHNLPPTALLALPVAWLDYPSARLAWPLLSLGALALAGGWLMWRLGLRGRLLPACIALALAWAPSQLDLVYGQAYTVMLAALIVVWQGLRAQQHAVAGLALAYALLTRVAGGLLWPGLAVRGRWRAVVWGLAGAVAVCVVSLPWLRPAAWQPALASFPRFTTGPQTSVTAYQTWQGWSRHLFAYDAYWNPAPLINIPAVAEALALTGVIAVAVVTLWCAARATNVDLAIAMLVLAGLVVSPVSQEYHYVLALLPVLLLIAWMQDRRAAGAWAALAAGLLLAGADLPYEVPALRSGARALLAYPRLYGALLLWGVALWAARQPALESG